MKKISIDVKNCMSCKSCEVHCAVAHSASRNLHAAISAIPASTSRIRVRSTKTANKSRNVYFELAESAFKNLYDPVTGRSIPQLQDGSESANPVSAQPRIRIKPTKKTKVEITQCKHCRNPRCLDSCEHNAITKDAKTGLTIIDGEYCKKCLSMACLEACPFEAIVMERANNTILICDQCQEKEIPACVSACPVGVLQIN